MNYGTQVVWDAKDELKGVMDELWVLRDVRDGYGVLRHLKGRLEGVKDEPRVVGDVRDERRTLGDVKDKLKGVTDQLMDLEDEAKNVRFDVRDVWDMR